MLYVVYVLPLVAVVGVLASGRASLLAAGATGLALTVPAAALALGRWDAGLLAFLAAEGAAGAWIALQAVAIILAGLLFYQVVRGAQPALFAPAAARGGEIEHRRLFMVCFLLGPFAEAATGFGVGSVIAIAALLRMGLTGAPAAVFSLFSQTLVPWGGLAVGTLVGAGLAGMTPEALGAGSALLTLPLLLGYLVVFWWLADGQGLRVTTAEMVDDIAWLLALGGLIYAGNRLLGVEVAVLSAAGLLLALRFLRDTPARSRHWPTVLRAAAPFAALTLVLLLTRAVPPLRDVLQGVLVVQPAAGLPAFAPLYHASVMLAAVGVGYGLLQRGGPAWGRVLHELWRAGRAPVAVTFLFVVMAQWMRSAGVAAALASGWADVAGGLAVVATPLFGGAAGFLTASNVAGNGMMMPLQAALAEQAGVALEWVAALQNTAGANLTLLSPMRVSMACAVVGLAGQERLAYRLAWPLGAVALAILCGVALLL